MLPATIADLQAHYQTKDVGSSTLDTCIQQYWGETPGYLSERQHSLTASAFTDYGKVPPLPRSIKLSLAENAVQVRWH
jgi:hypothetical protein